MTPRDNQLRTYQREDRDWLVKLSQAKTPALLAADTRLGKTMVVLSAADKIQARRILVAAPATGRTSWPIEVHKWAPDRAKHMLVLGPGMKPSDPAVQKALRAPDALVIVAYDALSLKPSPWLNALRAEHWDVLVLDEAQYLKSPGANRTKAVYARNGLAAAAYNVWLLSGTPTPNHAGELFSHYSALWPQAFGAPMNQHQFEDRFCRVVLRHFNGREVRTIEGSNGPKLPELRKALGPYVQRRKKQDVIKDLPPIQHTQVNLDVTLPAGVPVLPPETQEMTDDQFLAWVTRDKSLAPKVRHMLGAAKIDAAHAWIEEQFDLGIRKIVVFAWHVVVLEKLHEKLGTPRSVLYAGATSGTLRDQAVRKFQNDPATRVFLGQVKAAGTAICLDAADDVAMVEASTVPGDNYQAYSRIQNVTSPQPITVSWLSVPNSADERLQAILRQKAQDIAALF